LIEFKIDIGLGPACNSTHPTNGGRNYPKTQVACISCLRENAPLCGRHSSRAEFVGFVTPGRLIFNNWKCGRIEILEDGIEQRIKKRFVEADSNLGLLRIRRRKKTKKPPTRRQRLV